MRVSMEYFMKRRNLGWASFQGLEYDRYVKWCAVRKIIPVDKDEFISHKQDIKKEEPVIDKTLPPNPKHSDAKSLGRKKKADLVDLASVYGIELNGTETKKQLVSLIVDVNKG